MKLSFREIISCIAVICVGLVLAVAVSVVVALEDDNKEVQNTVASVEEKIDTYVSLK